MYDTDPTDPTLNQPYDPTTPAPPPAPTPGAPPMPDWATAWMQAHPGQNPLFSSTAGDTPQTWLQRYLTAGRNPSDLAYFANQVFNLPSGAGAQYYGPEVHGVASVGLPGGYFSNDPGSGWAWHARGPETGALGNGALGPLLQPFTEQAPGYTPPPAFSYPDFAMPSADAVYADPGYKFGRDEGLQALTNSSSAKGLLRSGGTLKDFIKYGTDFANTYYGNTVNRLFTAWGANRGNALDTYNTNYKTQYTDPLDIAYRRYGADFDRFKYNESWPYTVLSDQQRIGVTAATG